MLRTTKVILGLAFWLALCVSDARAGFFLYVNPTGLTESGMSAYTTIQGALDAATTGSTIVVDPGTYTENLTIGVQGITLQGAKAGVNPVSGRSGPESIITGAITITGADVTLDGFSVNANSQWAIEVGGASSPSVAATNAIIRNNIVQSTIYGIQIGAQGGPGSLVVPLHSLVENNIVVAGNSALVLFNTASNTVTGNKVTGSGFSGIDVYYSHNNTITFNDVNNSNLTGIRLRGSTGNLVEYNTGSGNGQPEIQEGEGSSDNTIRNNFGPGAVPIPEPSALLLALSGAGVVGWIGIRRRRSGYDGPTGLEL